MDEKSSPLVPRGIWLARELALLKKRVSPMLPTGRVQDDAAVELVLAMLAAASSRRAGEALLAAVNQVLRC